LNLIRVMPAEGWDAMLTSVYLARLIGPVMLAVGIGLLVNPAAYRTLAREFLDSTALVYLSGLLTMTAGLAIQLAAFSCWSAGPSASSRPTAPPTSGAAFSTAPA
jgi:hypothetical protein